MLIIGLDAINALSQTRDKLSRGFNIPAGCSKEVQGIGGVERIHH